VDVILGHVVLPGIRRVAHLAGGEAGEILVSYAARWSGWRLSVSDNGPGFAEVSDERPHTGLGTSIVEALAHQLNAKVQKSGGRQGTTVSIVVAPAEADA
jgi:two-component sensor histidine kinase